MEGTRKSLVTDFSSLVGNILEDILLRAPEENDGLGRLEFLMSLVEQGLGLSLSPNFSFFSKIREFPLRGTPLKGPEFAVNIQRQYEEFAIGLCLIIFIVKQC